MGDGERFWEMFTSFGCVVGLWSTTHTSGGGGCGATTAASVLNTQQRFVYIQRCRGSIPATPLRSQIIATLLKSQCSLVGDCCTPLPQHHALAWVCHL